MNRILFGVISVCVFGGGLASPPLLAVGILAAMVGTVARWQCVGALLSREPLFWLAVGLAGWVALRAWINLPAEGSLPGDPGAVWDHIRYTALVPMAVGCWVAAFWHLRQRVFLLICVGVLLYYLDNQAEIIQRLPIGGILKGSYPELGLIAVTIAALAAGFALHFRRQVQSDFRPGDWAQVLVLIAACFVSLTVFLLSQVRSAWLSMAALLLLLLVSAAYLGCTRGDAAHRRRYFIAVGVGTVLVLMVGFLLSDFIWWRLRSADDMSTLVAILDGRFGDEYEGSFAIRYRLLLQGLQDMMTHPWAGIGPAAIREAQQVSMVPGTWRGNYEITYLNMAVALGIPWAALWVLLHVVAVCRAAYRLMVFDRDIALGLGILCASFLHFTTLGFQVRLWSVQGSALYIILMSLVFAVLLRPKANASAARVSGSAATATDGTSAV
jgi:hypothetical protein